MLPQAVTVVIPAFNERPHVLAQVEDVEKTLRATDWDFEIIVVDDGSTDGTADEARKSSARVVSQRQNIGYGAAIRRGLAESRYDWILITDADGTYPTAAIPQLLAKAAENDMVVGARVGLNVRIPLVRKPAKAFLRWLASYLSGQHLPDLNSGLRLMRKSLLQRYEHLLPPGFSLTTTITMASACQAHPMEFVPIDYHARLGSSKIRPWHAYEFLILILRLSVLFNPLKVFMPIGAFIAAAGLAKFCYDLTLSNLSESAVLSLLAALLIWCVGLLADQSSRIAMHR
jgi:glycosyltransferase involved in cell wall biosynthesis